MRFIKTCCTITAFITLAVFSKSYAVDKSPGVGVLAIVDDKKLITLSDFHTESARLPDHLKSIAETPDGRKDMLETLIIREMILMEAYKEGVDKSSDVKEQLAGLKKRLMVEAYLRKHVESYKGDRNEAYQKVKETVKSKHRSFINYELLFGMK